MSERPVIFILIIASLALMGIGFLLYPVINPCKKIEAVDIKNYTNEIKTRITTANDSTLDAFADSFIASHR